MTDREFDGLDAEGYIAAVRAGAIDPFGQSAEELQDELDAYDAGFEERLAAMTPEQVAAGEQVPRLPGPPESEFVRLQREETEFVGRMRALERQRARLEAEQRELLAGRLSQVFEAGGAVETARRDAASVLAVELHLSDRTIEQRMISAWQVVQQLPQTHEAHRDGRITGGHLREIERATETLRLDASVEAEDKVRVERELVELAERATPAQVRSRAAKVVDRVLTAPLQQRFDAAKEQRSAGLFDGEDGMSDLVLHGPSVLLAGAFDRASQAARAKPKDDPRTFAQYRFDTILELLLAGTSPADLTGVNALTATVCVTIPATALLHDDEDADPALAFPALLDGRVLVDAATVRQLAAEAAVWERVFLDPVTGVPVTVDTYRPNRAQKRLLRARDGRCRWPGCNLPVSRADTDHTLDHARGGATALWNLAHLCRRHHTMKHATRWTVRQLPHGVLEWTSPLGLVIIDMPEPQGPRFVDTAAERTPTTNDPWGTADPGWPPGEPEPEWAHAPEYGGHPPGPPPAATAA